MTSQKCSDSANTSCCPYNNPAPLCFEEDLEAFEVVGLGEAQCPEFEVTQGTYPDPLTKEPMPNPTSVIREDQAFAVTLRWQATGHAVHYVTGDWRYAVHLHRVDAASGYIVKEGSLNMNTDEHVFPVSETLDFAPGAVPSGVYKVYVTVKFYIPGKGWAAMAGFGKGMALNIYNPKAD